MIWSVEHGRRQQVVRVDLQGHLTADGSNVLLTRLEEIFRENSAVLVLDGSRVSGCHDNLGSCWAARVMPFRASVEALLVGYNSVGMGRFKSAMTSFAMQLQVKYELRPGALAQANAELRRELADRFHLGALAP